MTIKGRNLAGASGARGRVANDYYATPPETTRAILDRVELSGSILEPACGEGHISEELRRYYPDSEIISTDLIDRGYGGGDVDFLTHDYGRQFDNVITNPPFALAKEFIERALELAREKVVIFARIQLLESAKRRELFETYPPSYVYVFSERQPMWRNGQATDENGKRWATTQCYAWFVWDKRKAGAEPVIRWI